MKFKTKPYQHQLEAYNASKDMKAYAYLMEMGTGKTKVAIDNFCYLYDKGEINGVLIIAPKGVYLNWRATEIPIHIWEDVPHRIAVYSAYQKAADKKALKEIMEVESEALNILLINVEALATKRGLLTAVDFCDNHDVMSIIDESTVIKNPKSKRAKASMVISMVSKYRRILTGTPITQSPLDLFSQFEFLEKGSSGFTSFFAFKHYYADQRTMTLGNRSFQKIVGYRNLPELTNTISPMSMRVMKSECLDLPEKIYMKREVALTEEQKLMYMSLKHQSLVMLEDGLLTSNNALTTMVKLHQITCGHVKDDFGTTIDIPNNRIDALNDIIGEINTHSKVIIWCCFQRDVEIIKKELGNEAVTHYGLDNAKERENALSRFKDDDTCRYFIGTPQCGGRGLTLNNANYVIYYSNSFKLEDRLQSEDRCHRIGQDKNVTYIDLFTPKTIDVIVLSALKDKTNLADSVLADVESFRNVV